MIASYGAFDTICNPAVAGTFHGDNIRITSGTFDFNDEGNGNAPAPHIGAQTDLHTVELHCISSNEIV